MERTLSASDCAKRSAKDAAYAWSRQQYLLSAGWNSRCDENANHSSINLKEETARLFRRPRGAVRHRRQS